MAAAVRGGLVVERDGEEPPVNPARPNEMGLTINPEAVKAALAHE